MFHFRTKEELDNEVFCKQLSIHIGKHVFNVGIFNFKNVTCINLNFIDIS